MKDGRLYNVMLREMHRIWRNPRYIIILSLGIILTFVFFMTMTTEGQPKKLSVAVVDMDGTYLSRRICHEINATEGVNVRAVYNNHTEARKAMQRGEIFAFYEIPKGTYNNLLQFRSPHFVLYVNSAYMLAGTLSYKQLAMMGMLATGAVQREVYRKKGYNDEQIMGLIQPVEYDTRNIGNPWINYSNYLMTTLIPAVIAFIVLMHTAYVIARERQERTLKSWLRRAKGNTLLALIGKMLPYTFWYSFLCLLANLIMFGFMGFPLEGSWLLMVLNTILLVFAAQCAACFIASCIPDPPLIMGISALYSAMSFSLSGFSFPVESMPIFFHSFAWLYPIRHYFLNFSDITIYGNGMSHCWPRFCALLAFGILPVLGAMMINWQQRREERLTPRTKKTDAQ
ncbi:MAG: ABC transporter permease [Bacteroidales bacterium]|nr:ABC transporter permease [Bacteroidales bacterium]